MIPFLSAQIINYGIQIISEFSSIILTCAANFSDNRVIMHD